MNKNVADRLEDKARDAVLHFKALINLRADMDQEGTVETIRANVDFRSANAWTLVFAILIASIGLNVNSTAVIIGAMLISPLMGPIIGAGFGLGVNDLPLVKRSLSNLSFAVAISLAASFLYFLISPLSEAQTELLARTRPTFFDAMIAIFGGAAGIVALSRKEKGNAIPGVAIATALMPPLCTAGFALSQGKFSYFFGAMYLFVINSVYISLSTLAFIKYMGFRKVAVPDEEERRKVRRWVFAIGMLVLIPSLVSAWLLLRESAFRSRATAFVKHELQIEGAFVVGTEIAYDWRKPKLIVNVVGEPVPEERIRELQLKMKERFLPEDSLVIHQSSFAQRIEQNIRRGLEAREKESQASELRIASLEHLLKGYRHLDSLSREVTAELTPLFPRIREVVIVAAGENPELSPASEHKFFVQWVSRPPKTDLAKVDAFLRARSKAPQAAIGHFTAVPN